MAKIFLSPVDLRQNELQNAVIQVLALAPTTPVVGQVYFNSADSKLYIRETTGWKNISGELNDVNSGTNALIATDNGDNTITLTIADATGANSGLLTSTFFDLLNNATAAATPDTLVIRDVNGDIAVNNIAATTGMTIGGLPVATQQYVDNLVASGMNIVGAIDASTNPNYPVASDAGDAWSISAPGLIGGASGVQVEAGDMLIALQATPGGTEAAVGNQFIIIQSNVDQATDTIRGLLRIATAAESATGTDNTTAITPLSLATALAALGAAGKFAMDIGDASATNIVVTHNLGTSDVHVIARDTVTNEIVEVCTTITDDNNITFDFSTAPLTNAIRVVVSG